MDRKAGQAGNDDRGLLRKRIHKYAGKFLDSDGTFNTAEVEGPKAVYRGYSSDIYCRLIVPARLLVKVEENLDQCIQFVF